MARPEAERLFEAEWKQYEASFVVRLDSVQKSPHGLAHTVTLLFNHAVAKLAPEGGAFALLKEHGPQVLSAAAGPVPGRGGEELRAASTAAAGRVGPRTLADMDDQE